MFFFRWSTFYIKTGKLQQQQKTLQIVILNYKSSELKSIAQANTTTNIIRNKVTTTITTTNSTSQATKPMPKYYPETMQITFKACAK
jgi:hypothetical protein